MDNCNKIKDLILTDYTDGQLDLALKQQIESHLRQCASCQVFAQEARETLVVPFQKVNRHEVPSQIWQHIQERIQKEQYSNQGLLDIIKNWLANVSFPKLMPALASLVILVVVSSTLFLNAQPPKQLQEQPQASYTDMLVFNGSDVRTDTNESGTPIERYFL